MTKLLHSEEEDDARFWEYIRGLNKRLVERESLPCEEENDKRYDAARLWFDTAVSEFTRHPKNRMYRRIGAGIVAGNLSLCIKALNSMYLDGKVETLEGLPNSSDIRRLDYLGFGRLIKDLQERYFPTQEVFEAA